MSASAAEPPTPAARAARRWRPRGQLDAKALPLAPDRFPQIAQLRFNGIVNRVPGAAHVIDDVLPNRIARNPVPQLLAAVGGPPRTGSAQRLGAPSGPARPATHPAQDGRERA